MFDSTALHDFEIKIVSSLSAASNGIHTAELQRSHILFLLRLEILETSFFNRKKSRFLFIEIQLYFPCRSVAVFLNQDLCDIRLVRILSVLIFPMYEHHDIGVLFDRTGIPEVREARLASASFHRARELGEREHGNIKLARKLFE